VDVHGDLSPGYGDGEIPVVNHQIIKPSSGEHHDPDGSTKDLCPNILFLNTWFKHIMFFGTPSLCSIHIDSTSSFSYFSC